MDSQRDAQFEGLAIGLEQRGEKSAAHLVRLKQAEIERLRAENDELRRAVRNWENNCKYCNDKDVNEQNAITNDPELPIEPLKMSGPFFDKDR